jgi:hypothetical protein
MEKRRAVRKIAARPNEEPHINPDVMEAMARPKRFELLTPRFVVWCSIQLSYGRVSRGANLCRQKADSKPS